MMLNIVCEIVRQIVFGVLYKAYHDRYSKVSTAPLDLNNSALYFHRWYINIQLYYFYSIWDGSVYRSWRWAGRWYSGRWAGTINYSYNRQSPVTATPAIILSTKLLCRYEIHTGYHSLWVELHIKIHWDLMICRHLFCFLAVVVHF